MRPDLGIAVVVALAAPATSGLAIARADEAATSTSARNSSVDEDVGAAFPHIAVPPFAEDRVEPGTGWSTDFHGTARTPLRFNGSLAHARPPYLVDDDADLSGFLYTRVSETEWVEAFLGVRRDRTRFVLGLAASRLSDWSETSLEGQAGIATAFVEHATRAGALELGFRAGMFWDRFGYVRPYDTYVLGRAHIAGLRVAAIAWDRVYAKVGFGAHSDVITSNQGFTPLFWSSLGARFAWFDASFFYATTWTGDSERAFSIVEDASLDVWGGEGRLGLPHVGPLHAVVGFYHAEKVSFLAGAYEILHSRGGRILTQNFFGPNSDNGTGEALVLAFDLDWELERTARVLVGDPARYLRNAKILWFGLLANVASNQASENPLENFHDRLYVKWGVEPSYRPHLESWSWLFASMRFDRVIADTRYDSLAFRVLTSQLGVIPLSDFDLRVSLSHSRYFYGSNVKLRPNQIPGDLSATHPDEDVLAIRAEASW